jgi:hypothetical protein
MALHTKILTVPFPYDDSRRFTRIRVHKQLHNRHLDHKDNPLRDQVAPVLADWSIQAALEPRFRSRVALLASDVLALPASGSPAHDED